MHGPLNVKQCEDNCIHS